MFLLLLISLTLQSLSLKRTQYIAKHCCHLTRTCINSVPKSASVVTPPVNTSLTNWGALSLISFTNTMTLSIVLSLWSKRLLLTRGGLTQSSLAWTTRKCISASSRSSFWATWREQRFNLKNVTWRYKFKHLVYTIF